MNKVDWEKKVPKSSLTNKEWYEIFITLRKIGIKHDELELLTVADKVKKGLEVIR